VWLEKGEQFLVAPPKEGSESPAVVVQVSSLGTGMNRMRLQVPKSRKFGRAAAKKKYIYDYGAESWAGCLSNGMSHNSKHEPFGKVEENLILSVSTGRTLFRLAGGRMYDRRGNCLGHII
jgi:hypothetical protein